MDKSEQAVSVFDRRAHDYQSRFMDVSLYHDSLDAFCNRLPPDARVLELACGPGNITRYLLDQRNDLKILGTDLSPNMIALATINNPEAAFAVMDIRDVARSGQAYDAIVCGFGLPYLSKDEAIALIADMAKTLNRGGWVYLSTMEDDYGKSGMQYSSDGKDAVFIHFHQSDYLCDALLASGFEIALHKRQVFEPNPDTTDLILIGHLT